MFVTRMRKAFKQRDWNAIVGDDGGLDHVAEELLSEGIDGPASPGLQRLRAGDVDLDPVDRVFVAAFIAAQVGRNPEFREAMERFDAEIAGQTLAIQAQHFTDEQWLEVAGEVPDQAMRDRIARGEGFEIVFDKSDLFVSQQVAHDIAPMVAAMSWVHVEFEVPCLFSSGQPVIHLVERPGLFGVGFGNADLTYVPLTPSRALVLRPFDGEDHVVVGSHGLARALNFRMLVAPLSTRVLQCPDVLVHPLPVTAGQARFPYELMKQV